MKPLAGAATSLTAAVRGGRGILRGLLVALPLLGGCAGFGAPIPSAVLPPDAVEGAGDPTRAAIINTAYAFNAPASLAGRPDEAARAVATYVIVRHDRFHGAVRRFGGVETPDPRT